MAVIVIMTGLRVQGPKLSRKSGYCDRFQGSRPKPVKKMLLL